MNVRNWGAPVPRARVGEMKWWAGVAIGLGLMVLATVGCATAPNPKPNPCIGSYVARQTMPCTCPGSTDPACYPFPQDAKKPKKTTTEGDRK